MIKGDKGCVGIAAKFKGPSDNFWFIFSMQKKKTHFILSTSFNYPRRMNKISIDPILPDIW